MSSRRWISVMLQALVASALLVLGWVPGACSELGPDFVRVGANGCYLELHGEPFIPVGFNDAVSWGNLLFLFNDVAPGVTEDYFTQLRRHGINTLRVMVSYSQDRDGYYEMENPVGHPRPEMVGLWDRLVGLAERFGVYLIVTLWDPFWMARNWDVSPWNLRNGGPCRVLSDMLTGQDAIRLEKNQFAFLVDRYGGSSHILAWELANEIDLWFRGDQMPTEFAEEILRWTSTMARFIKDRELGRYGRRHLITLSTADPNPDGPVGRAVYDNPEVDFVTTHMYYDPVKNPTTPLEAALAVQNGMIYQLYRTGGRKPYLDSESGPIDRWPLRKDEDVPYYHAMCWAAVMSGAAGPGLRWPYTATGTLDDDYYAVLAAVDRFVCGVPWTTEDFEQVAPHNLVLPRGAPLAAFGLVGRSHAQLWLVREPYGGAAAVETAETVKAAETAETAETVEIEVKGLADGGYAVEYWDTWLGRVVGSAEAGARDSRLTVELPPFVHDLALKVYPKR